MNKLTLKFILSYFLVLFTLIVNAQIVAFQKSYTGGSSNFIMQTTDEGYISVGETDSSGIGNLDIVLVKTNSSGDVLWTKSYGGLGNESGQSISKTSDGGYIVTGYTNTSGAGSSDIILLRTDSVGTILWTKTIGGVDNDYGYSVFQESDGSFVIDAGTTSFGNFGGASNLEDFYLIKTDSLGNLIWTKVIGTTGIDHCSVAKKTTDKGFFLIGSNTYYASPSIYDVFIVKTDSLGNVEWSKTFGGNNWDLGYAGQQTIDGGYIICGTTKSFGSGSEDLYLLKIDGTGNLLWSKTISVNGNINGVIIGSDTKSTSIQQTTDGGYIISGDRDTLSGPGQDIFLLKTDSIGNVINAKIYNNGGGAFLKKSYSVSQTTDGGVILSGIDYFNTGIFYLIRTDSICNSNCIEYDVLTTLTNPTTNITNPTVLSITGGISNIVTISMTNNNISSTDICMSVEIGGIDKAPNETNDILIYPNPTTGILKLECDKLRIQNVEIYNLFGEKVFHALNLNLKTENEMDLSSLPKGAYFMRASIENKIYDKKIIVQ